MANTEWWQRGPVPDVPALLQPVAHILLQVGESVDEFLKYLPDLPADTARWVMGELQ